MSDIGIRIKSDEPADKQARVDMGNHSAGPMPLGHAYAVLHYLNGGTDEETIKVAKQALGLTDGYGTGIGDWSRD